MNKVIFQIEKVSCPSCLQKIENVVIELPGVTNVSSLYNLNKILVSYEPKQQDIKTIEKNIEDLGYDVIYIKEK